MLTFPFFFTHLNISENLDIHSKNQVPPKYLQSMPTASFKKFLKRVFCVRKKCPFYPPRVSKQRAAKHM